MIMMIMMIIVIIMMYIDKYDLHSQSFMEP